MRALAAIIISLAVFWAFGATEDGQDWSVSASNDWRQVIVCNANRERSGEGIVCKWTVLRNGEPYAADVFDLKGLRPGESHVYTVPEALDEVRRRGDKASLRLRFIAVPETELARRQLDVPDDVPAVYQPIDGEPLEMTEDGETLRFSSEGLVVSFSKRTGLLTDMRREGFFSDDVLVAEPMRIVMVGAPDLSPVWTLERLSSVDLLPTQAHFTAVAQARTAELEALLELDWIVYRDGAVRCSCRFRPTHGKSLSPGAGLFVPTCSDSAEIDFFAIEKGLLGRYSAEAATLSARREAIRGTRALEVKDGAALLGFAAVGRPFAVTVLTDKTVGIVICPDGDVDCRRPRRIDFMIGLRRFANVVGAN